MLQWGIAGSDLDFTAETTTGGCGAAEGTIVVNATGGMGGVTLTVLGQVYSDPLTPLIMFPVAHTMLR